MEINRLEKISSEEWAIQPYRYPNRNMRVPGIIYGSEKLLKDMDDKVFEQVCHVAALPGIIGASYAMPDAHWGYGFPIGGVAAFDPEEGGVISAGGVGFDISCGVRLLISSIERKEFEPLKEKIADALFQKIPSGVGSKSSIRLTMGELDEVLLGGARWALEHGYGLKEDLLYLEENGRIEAAMPEHVSDHAKKRQLPEMGTLGSGNHYFEVQEVTEIFDEKAAAAFRLQKGMIFVSIHCGSRGLGHQIGTDYLRQMVIEAPSHGLVLPDRELACAPIRSVTGKKYLGAMRAGINCAMANRQILTHFAREAFQEFFPGERWSVLYDVSHNTCKEEVHRVGRVQKKLFVHRKGATRALGPEHEELPEVFRKTGQPVIIGGSMGTGSYVLVGMESSETKSWSSSCHGAGRAISRTQALKLWNGPKVIQELKNQGIIVKTGSDRGVAEEAPEAYKNVREVVDSAENAGLSKKVAYLKPIICVKG